jgi:hypothetical protein
MGSWKEKYYDNNKANNIPDLKNWNFLTLKALKAPKACDRNASLPRTCSVFLVS